MHIAVTPDEAYIPHCAAMLHSLIAHHPGVPLDIHLLTGPVKPYWSDLGRYLDGLGSRLHIHVVSESVWTQLPETGFPRNAWLKIFLPDLLEASRVLYLDCDLIVRQNLSAIYAMDMRGRWVAAVQELIWKGSLRRLHAHVAGLGLVRPEDYFNVGVLLLDLERMRQEQCSMRMLSYAADPATPKRLPEQEAFNAAAGGHWQRLPLKWNVTVPAFLDREFDVHLDPMELNEARHSPGIVHLCSADKPWLRNCRHPYRADYIRHRNATPWADAKAEYRQLDMPTRIVQSLPLSFKMLVYRALRSQSRLPPKRPG